MLPQHGYCLIAMPGATMSNGSPQPLSAFAASWCPAPLNTARKPCGCSNAPSFAVKPWRASSAAYSPLRAQWPTCSDFTMVPKFAFRPEDSEAAVAIAVAVRSPSRPSRREAAAAAPNTPSVAVGCQPFS